MGKIFDLDNPVMRFMAKLGDLIVLNLLVMICSLPIITIGASLTGMHYVVLKMARGQDGYVVKGFFKSFWQNFKQSTVIWLIQLAFIVVFVVDFFIFQNSGIDFPKFFFVLYFAVLVVFYFTSLYIYPLLARFDNNIKNTIKNAFFMIVLNLPKTIAMGILYILPFGILLVSTYATPIVFMFCFSAPALAAAYLYSGIFMKFEPEVEITSDMDFKVELENEGNAESQ